MITRQQILGFIEDTRSLAGDDVADILNLAKRYPYCQTLQLLKIIGLKNNDDIEYKNQLNLASVYSGDRHLLYEYIIRENLLQTIAAGESEPGEAVPGPEQAEDQLHSSAESEVAEAPVEHTPTEETEKAASESVLNPLPLEEQILQAAMVHTAELEVDHSLKKLPVLQQPEAKTPPANAPLTFSQWLLQKDGKAVAPKKPAEEAPTTSPEDSALAEKDLIDTFIETKPQISPVKASFFSPVNMGKMSLIEDESFVTETLAGIYMKQGEYKKAIRAYENLSLKFPEKKTYFARLIKEAEEKTQKKN